MSNYDIIHQDEYKIYDKLLTSHKQQNNMIGPLGWVRVLFGDNLIHEGPNMVVAKGREFVAQRLFGTNAYLTGTRTNYTSYKVSHFGIGSGGASVLNDQVTLNGPHMSDVGLYKPITLGNSGYLNDPSNYNVGDGIHLYTDSVKPIATDGSIYLEAETYNDNGVVTYYTKVKSTCVVPAGEPSVIDDGDYVQVSEAALYFVYNTTVNLFAHICFAPKYKEKENQITILWYTLC